MTAALRTHTIPLVEKLVADGRDIWSTYSPFFGSASTLVAKSGNHKLLAAMMIVDPDNVLGFHKRRYEVLSLVAEYGNLEAARFAYYYKTDQYPWNIYERSCPTHYRHSERTLSELETSDPEIFEFLQEKRKIHDVPGEFGPSQHSRFLRYSSRRGWTAMAARYLEMGAQPGAPGNPDEQQSLLCAISRGYTDLVRLFLWHGASVRNCPKPMEQAASRRNHDMVQMLLHHNAKPGEAVYLAAVRRYWDIVLEIIRHGVVGKADLQRCLVRTVSSEHKAIFRLLLSYGARVSAVKTLEECLVTARTEGLESMLKLVIETEQTEREGMRLPSMRK